MMGSRIELEREAFARHLANVYKQWENIGSDIDCLVLMNGKSQEDIPYMKSTAIQTYLFAYEFSDTLMLLTNTKVIFYSSIKKLDILRQLAPKSDADYKGLKLEFVEKTKGSNDEALATLWDAMKASKQGEKMGVLSKDRLAGPFVEAWEEFVGTKTPAMEKVDVAHVIGAALAIKDGDELAIMKRAATLSAKVMDNYFRGRLETVIEDEKKIKHAELAEDVESAILEPEKAKAQINKELVEACYTPIVQSGGSYDLRPSATSDNKVLSADVVICSLGSRYKFYCSNVARTYLINPSKEQEDNYKLLEKLRAHIISFIKPGLTCADVYNEAVAYLDKHKPELRDHLTKNLGFGMGIEFRDSQLLINAKNHAKIKLDMTFNLTLGLENLENKDGKPETYALLIADTVVVQPGEASVLTEKCPYTFNDIIYTFDDEQADVGKESAPAKAKREDDAGRATRSGAVLTGRTRQADRNEPSTTEQVRSKQMELLEQINKRARDRLVRGSADDAAESIDINSITAYESPASVPRDAPVQQLKIFIDKKRDALLCPVYGMALPFHIKMVKNVAMMKGDTPILRINFNTPTMTGRREGAMAFAGPDAAWIKELTYRSGDQLYLESVANQIREFQRSFKLKETEMREKADLVKQDALKLARNGQTYARLKNLLLRPPVNNKLRRAVGVLEAHENGFRYTMTGNIKLDILYANIKFAFFQPCKHEDMAIIHFTLKDAIKGPYVKKTSEIQFYTPRSTEAQIETNSRNQRYGDADEIHLEEKEREAQKRLDDAFRSFIKKAMEVATDVRFEKPERKAAFKGKWGRSMMDMMPTPSALVSLSEWPPFVQGLDDIEFVHLERTGFGSRSFDIVIIPKDYKKIEKIEAIDMKQLDAVKQWLNEVNICFTEANRALKWEELLKVARDNPRDFFDMEGGWTALFGASDDEEEDELDEGDEEFAPSESEFEEEEESESEYTDEEEEESEYSEEDTEGEDWDELEEWARREDKKHYEEADDDDRGTKRKKSAKSAPPPKKRR